MGDGLQDLRRACGIGRGPQKIAARLDQRGRKRIEKTPSRQGDGQRGGLACLPNGIGGRKGDRHRQIGEGML